MISGRSCCETFNFCNALIFYLFLFPVFLLQSDWIRENCASQMERVRDNYNYQSQNIRDIKQYGSAQISAVREQYYEQVRKNNLGDF